MRPYCKPIEVGRFCLSIYSLDRRGFRWRLNLELRFFDRTTQDKIMKNPSSESIYTCPMHPEIRSAQPGNCPKCGMTLEPLNDNTAQAGIEYVCPMHPEVIRTEPGDCPKCGMSLELRETSVAEAENHEYEGMSRRFWLCTALTLPVFILAMMHDMLPGVLPGDFVSQW